MPDTAFSTVDGLPLERIVELFAMERHPTCGWFAPHHIDSETRSRPSISSIYYLLPGDEPLPLGQLDATQVWHFYAGAPARFEVGDGVRAPMTSLLGRNFVGGERPQLAVPAFLWQSAGSLGAWTLLGATTSPARLARSSFVIDAGA